MGIGSLTEKDCLVVLMFEVQGEDGIERYPTSDKNSIKMNEVNITL
jgi:hypothetical protein